MTKCSFGNLLGLVSAILFAAGGTCAAAMPTSAAANARRNTVAAIPPAPFSLPLVLADDHEIGGRSGQSSNDPVAPTDGPDAKSPNSCIELQVLWAMPGANFGTLDVGTFNIFVPAGDFGFYSPDPGTMFGGRPGGKRVFDLRAQWFSNRIDFEYSVDPICPTAPFDDTYAFSLRTDLLNTERPFDRWQSWSDSPFGCVAAGRHALALGQASVAKITAVSPSRCIEAQ